MTPLQVSPALAAQWRAAADADPRPTLPLADVLDLRAVCAALPLPAGLQLVASQCWVRRAMPPHSWHQDGALHHDFQTDAPPLPMWTAWIALTRCGDDAPGLEWIDAPLARLLLPSELTDDAVRQRFGTPVQRVFEAGEGAWFDGTLLHRTHRPPGALRPRTSIELRFIAEGPPPDRLAAERRLALR